MVQNLRKIMNSDHNYHNLKLQVHIQFCPKENFNQSLLFLIVNTHHQFLGVLRRHNMRKNSDSIKTGTTIKPYWLQYPEKSNNEMKKIRNQNEFFSIFKLLVGLSWQVQFFNKQFYTTLKLFAVLICLSHFNNL